MARITRTVMLMKMAQVASLRGTCSRLQVGAVISRDGRILSTGYNGAPAGLPHCNHDQEKPIGYTNVPDSLIFKIEPGKVMALPDGTVTMGCQIAEHAERNAIAWAARNGVALLDSVMHCTHAPCHDCAKSIINAGIKSVSYVIPYRLTAGVELLEQAGIQVIAMADPA